MSVIFVVFPPGAGGNHLRNMIVSCLETSQKIASLYSNTMSTKHAKVGSNLQPNDIQLALENSQQNYVLHGHFGEIMSYQNQIRSIVDKKFVILCPDTARDRQLLNDRQKKLHLKREVANDDYFEQEQVFLYEPFMYHWYFQIPMEDIMNIPITEWFVRDIDDVLARISWLLKININKIDITKMHYRWLEDNNL